MFEQHVKDIINNYERKRMANGRKKEIRIKEVYEKVPKIEEIDKEIRFTGISLSRSILMGQGNPDEIIENMKNKIEKLKQEKAILLTENNIPLNYLEDEYDCTQCHDKGYLSNGSKCSCFKQQLINYAFSMSNLSNILEKENFHTFDINVFSDEPYEEGLISPRENMLDILNVSEGFVFNFDNANEENLLFYGSTGLGKTFLINCISKALLNKGKMVIYQTAFKLIEILESIRFGEKSNNNDKYNLIFDADLLVIDDLGTEMTNSFTNSELFNIINSRLLANKKTIISTNLSPKEIIERYDDRIFSRVFSKFTILHFYGHDLRWEVK
ncbi:ATP-binding protein [Serpentinicella alkaliphila]|uniref:DNA replication protein DnaC n=1 Tax=Serpentinicella alkaliphila TaxID=1734049 RepID=A0A4R2TLZ4_9FIRM|nr:ATP-binding protein [Serpentinicella alkaliphila]QUH25174.1 ATP-binding protein [Serpentinicella alkaliphila]TCQ02265.1 DNA replication protein DnaC [Serpentinicella alkaliphila]